MNWISRELIHKTDKHKHVSFMNIWTRNSRWALTHTFCPLYVFLLYKNEDDASSLQSNFVSWIDNNIKDHTNTFGRFCCVFINSPTTVRKEKYEKTLKCLVSFYLINTRVDKCVTRRVTNLFCEPFGKSDNLPTNVIKNKKEIEIILI